MCNPCCAFVAERKNIRIAAPLSIYLIWRKATKRRFEIGFEYGATINGKRPFYVKGAVEMRRDKATGFTTWHGSVERRQRMQTVGGHFYKIVVSPDVQTFPSKTEAMGWVQALVVLGEDEE